MMALLRCFKEHQCWQKLFLNSFINDSLLLLQSFEVIKVGSTALLCCWVHFEKYVNWNKKWYWWLSNTKYSNNTASIITAWCLYCRTEVSLGSLLLKVLLQGCSEDNGKVGKCYVLYLLRGSYFIRGYNSLEMFCVWHLHHFTLTPSILAFTRNGMTCRSVNRNVYLPTTQTPLQSTLTHYTESNETRLKNCITITKMKITNFAMDT
jgi:hypothetical protein